MIQILNAVLHRQSILTSVGDCSGINTRYVAVLQALCGGGEAGLATGLEGAWGLLLVVSMLWIVMLPCMCQASKHAEQVRYGRIELRCDSEVPAAGKWEAKEVLQARLTLDGGMGKLPSFRQERVCLEVRDELASGLDISTKLISVIPETSDGSKLQARFRRP